MNQSSFDFGSKPVEPVRCLGRTFKDDAERRETFRAELREWLKKPDARKIEGFPKASDDDIVALSDPPYYCACPNPWLGEFVKEWEKDKKSDGAEQSHYRREPFAADVSEGKNDPIYNAHSYHTKVPHKAIMRYILHYTEPGDIVFDGFCGTGMTGVAAQMCADADVVRSLGYQVAPDGTVSQKEMNPQTGKEEWKAFSRLGARRAVLCDLSPAATFIAANYNTPLDVERFQAEAERILNEVRKECGWMYETRGPNGEKGTINYTVWSDVYICPECGKELVFWNEAVDEKEGKVRDAFPCPHCGVKLTKKTMTRAKTSVYDTALKKPVEVARQVPVLINYTVGKKRFTKTPDADDLALISKIDGMEIPHWFPTDELPEGFNTEQPKRSHGISHVHQFYTKRSLWVLATLVTKSNISKCPSMCKFLFMQWVVGLSKLNRYSPHHYSQNNRNLAGTLYVGGQRSEVSIDYAFPSKLHRLAIAFANKINSYDFALQTADSECIGASSESMDYIFVDPPFGANINYSELNFIWESWVKVITDNTTEAIENEVQHKGIWEYRQLMESCFKEAFRLLKPGRWMTVEFSNTKAEVWNNIQSALSNAGFIVANVSALDKKQRSFKAVTTPTAVHQDLVISAYKPDEEFEARLKASAGGEKSVWDFVEAHLAHLPSVKRRGDVLATMPERVGVNLYNLMVASFLRRGLGVPLDMEPFQAGLAEHFVMRGEMAFLPNQAAEYDRAALWGGKPQQDVLFITNEATAIAWLRQSLSTKPRRQQEITPDYLQSVTEWDKKEVERDIKELLEENFLRYDGTDPVPGQIHTYLSTNWKELRNRDKDDPELREKAKDRWYVPNPAKAADLEKLREKSLLREFAGYIRAKKKLRSFRLEAVKCGCKAAWGRQDYKSIVDICAILPSEVVEGDEMLMLWRDMSYTRLAKPDVQMRLKL